MKQKVVSFVGRISVSGKRRVIYVPLEWNEELPDTKQVKISIEGFEL